ncbi:MFS general substrate transporter [Tilletiaria anomala UBC 951]|uniref:MFS general substrate transporter n=1 Tax=Tilletiaria anomala (strain ATCC 24038 / CBS 436.72 / UBC 951) TaxID=1037660 RepID=A0A066WPT4_TILAU|nr:MFS general substrate transporter [Tilletiaria anomala UBC 951]KDN52640.1 MFS general substrate transporter [Tilletiaria anomala UBC 951]
MAHNPSSAGPPLPRFTPAHPSSPTWPIAGPSSQNESQDQDATTPPQGPLKAPQSLRELLAADSAGSSSCVRNGRGYGAIDAARRHGRREAGASSEAAGALASTSTAAQRPSAPVLGPPPQQDISRWNRWHIWRQESADAKRMKQLQQRSGLAGSFSSRGLQPRDGDPLSIRINMKRWSRRAYGSIKGVWTGGSYFHEEEDADPSGSTHSYFFSRAQETIEEATYDPEAPLSSLRLALLTLSLAGAQVVWTLELAYGTPFLLSLGMSKEAVSLVWIAGPASGLFVQPVVGALSDADVASKYRRRKFMLFSAGFLCLSTLTLAFASPLSFFLVDVLGVGLGDWDPVRNHAAHYTTQVLSIISFWVLDFALNGLQASSRTLILDISPTSQQTDANAWQGIMSNAGNMLGYLAGWIDLGRWPLLSWVGGGQFRCFSLFSLVTMLLCVGITCASTTEHPKLNTSREHIPVSDGIEIAGTKLPLGQKLRKSLQGIWNTTRRLPRPVRRICATQAFNFCSWFGFLFYATTYYLEIKLQHDLHGKMGNYADSPGSDRDVEQGSFSMLMYALVALAAGVLLPYLALGSDSHARAPALTEAVPQAQQPLPVSAEHTSHVSLRSWTSKRTHRIYRALRYGITLRSFWSFGCFSFALIMCGTFFVHTPPQAVVLIALVGVPWSISAWAPYALIGEFVRETALGVSPFEFDDDHYGPRRSAQRRQERWRRSEMLAQEQATLAERERQAGFSLQGEDEPYPTENSLLDVTTPISPARNSARNDAQAALRDCQPLRPAWHNGNNGGVSSSQITVPEVPPSIVQDEGVMTGTILGIHNVAIVIPQLLMSFIASVLFAITDPSHKQPLRDGDSDASGSRSNEVTSVFVSFARVLLSASPQRDNAFSYGAVARQHPPAATYAAAAASASQVAWVLRFAGLMALIACFVARSIPLTRTERFRRGQLLDLGLGGGDEGEGEGEEDEGGAGTGTGAGLGVGPGASGEL